MTIELARRLLVGGIVSPRDMDHALVLSMVRKVPATRVLVDRGVITERLLEEEIARFSGPALRQIAPAVEWARKFPPAMFRALGAVPIRFDAQTQTLEVAAIDPSDAHLITEFSFHAGVPVRAMRGTVSAIEEAIRRVELGDEMHPTRDRRRTPAFPHGAPRSSNPPPGDEVPIPLVRRVVDGPKALLRDEPKLALESDPPPRAVSFPSEPPMRLSSSPGPVGAVAGSVRPWLPPSDTFARGFEAVDPSPSIEVLVERVQSARSREAVVEATLTAMASVARRVGVLAIKKEGYYGLRCNRALGDPAIFRQIVVAADTPTIFATATATGHYLGPVPSTPAHRSVLRAVGIASSDVAVWVCKVAHKPAMLLLADDLDDPMRGTRTLEQIALATGEALTRLLSTR